MIVGLTAPEGAVLEFALLFGVVLLGPVVVRRARIPGIIGLLLGGFLIGPHGLGFIETGNQTIPELGQLGLLYLMFVAGLELDLRLLQEYRRAAVTFGILTFLLPFLAGVAVGFQQGWDVPAALLLGSLLASHTLILYPTIRDAGRAANPAVATAVGATVLTDTLALVVLAGVAGTSTGEGSTASVLAEVAIGLVVLVLVALLVLPRAASAALRFWGGDRAARYLVSFVSFLVMAMLAEVFSIEGIVGAFFAGLALNRLVPNEGPSMDRIEFFGSAIFIPVFLVSVGLLLDPSVMFTSETLGIAALLCVACLGGKALAAALAQPLLHFSRSESGVMFVLTTPQAAATLAATIVGFEIGLFGTAVVNAVLVLILVSILVSTLLADRYAQRITAAERAGTVLGDRVLLASSGDGPTDTAVRVATLLAAHDGGLVDIVLAHREHERPPSAAALRAIEQRVFSGPVEGEVRSVVDRDVPDAIAHACLTEPPSVVLLDVTVRPFGDAWAAHRHHVDHLPVLVLAGDPAAAPASVVLVEVDPTGAGSAAAVAARLAHGRPDRVRRVDAAQVAGLAPGAVVVTPITDWAQLDDLAEPMGSIVVAVIDATAHDDLEAIATT